MRINFFISLFIVFFFIDAGNAVFASGSGDTDGRIRAEKEELEKLRKAIAIEKKKVFHLEDREKSTLQKIQKISRKLDIQKKELKVYDMELTLNQNRIKDSEKKLLHIIAIAKNQEKVLSGRIRALYKEGNFSYLKVIFSSDSLSDLTNRITYMKAIAEADSNLFNEILNSKTKIEVTKTDLVFANEKLASLKKKVLNKRKKYLDEKNVKNHFLRNIQKEKSLYEQSVEELYAASESVRKLILRLGKKGMAQISLEDFEGLGTNLLWPVKGKLISTFGEKYNSKYRTRTFNHGIVIQSGFSQNVSAVAEGKILYADWLKGYGKLLIIGHGKGYHSLYGYLDKYVVRLGSIVQKGQIIANAGDTGSISGPSLYFEIRRKGKPVDPLKWLASSKKK